VSGGNVKIIVIDGVYEAFGSVYFVLEGQITLPPIVRVAEVVTGRNMIKLHEPWVLYTVLW
jgi:hypothetical protein